MKKQLIIWAMMCCFFSAYAQETNIQKSIEEGIKTSIQQTENREWKEAFATCRELDALIHAHEKGTKKQAPELHYQVSKERLRMYMRLNNAEQSKLQIEKLEDWANQAQQNALSEDLLMTKAGYFQKFGMNDKSLQCYKQLVQKRSAGQDENGTNICFQDMLAQAKKSNNASLTQALERLYINWQDSIKGVKAASELKSLKDEYAATQSTLQEKESKITTQQGFIIFLCILAVALGGALLFFIGVMFKHINQIKKLKHSLSIANDNNEQKSKFIYNISEQLAPSLDAIENGQAKTHIKALKNFMAISNRTWSLSVLVRSIIRLRI